jgi:hypothetical protein
MQDNNIFNRVIIAVTSCYYFTDDCISVLPYLPPLSKIGLPPLKIFLPTSHFHLTFDPISGRRIFRTAVRTFAWVLFVSVPDALPKSDATERPCKSDSFNGEVCLVSQCSHFTGIQEGVLE